MIFRVRNYKENKYWPKFLHFTVFMCKNLLQISLDCSYYIKWEDIEYEIKDNIDMVFGPLMWKVLPIRIHINIYDTTKRALNIIWISHHTMSVVGSHYKSFNNTYQASNRVQLEVLPKNPISGKFISKWNQKSKTKHLIFVS